MFPPPTVSVYDSRRHPWLALPAAMERRGVELWALVDPLYRQGDYGEAADRGRTLLEAHPEYADLFYNVACCESLAGRTADAVDHLRTAIDMSQGLRADARDDSDFDPIREEPSFKELVGG
jgi:tetratricopeptide (TPR) repeat protein